MNSHTKPKQQLAAGKHFSRNALLRKNKLGKILKPTMPNEPTLLVVHNVNVNGLLKALQKQRRNLTTATK
mgnify:CR=1 FL=1